jgi:hypothetical protein
MLTDFSALRQKVRTLGRRFGTLSPAAIRDSKSLGIVGLFPLGW